VNDHTTSVLTSRLHQLADELSPPLDVVGQVRATRSRRRRQRRVRIALVAAATVTAAALIGVPLGIGALSSSPDPGREAAHPVPATSAPVGGTESEDVSQRRVEQAATAARLHLLTEDLRTALLARVTPLSLGGPAAADSCAERAPTVNSAFGATPAEHSSGAAAGDCVWSTPDRDLQMALGFMAGGTVDQIHADVDAETGRAGCLLPTALPGSLTYTVLALCEEDGGTGWHFRVMDTSGTGFWLLSVTVGDQRPQDQVSTVAAVLDAADADL
jgi:hypothetical protein